MKEEKHMKINSRTPMEGYYLSKLLNAGEGEMELTKGGPCGTLIGTFELENMPISEKYKQQKYLAFPTNPKLRKLFTAILGEVPEDMDTDQLIGKECVVLIKHNTQAYTGKVFANIVDVFSTEEIPEEKLVNKPVVNKSAHEAEDLFNDKKV